MIRCYSELIKIPTFEERFEYLRLNGSVGQNTFGFDRYLNQIFYKSKRWRSVRDEVIVRDNGCDLACLNRPIYDRIIIHHMNPILLVDIVEESIFLLDPDFLISVSPNTHNAIHYSDSSLLMLDVPERKPNDTSPWKVRR